MSSSTEMTASASTLEPCRRSKRRWLITQWSFVVLLTVSIMVGLGGPVARLKQTIVMADNQFISDSSYEQLDSFYLRLSSGRAREGFGAHGLDSDFVFLDAELRSRSSSHRFRSAIFDAKTRG